MDDIDVILMMVRLSANADDDTNDNSYDDYDDNDIDVILMMVRLSADADDDDDTNDCKYDDNDIDVILMMMTMTKVRLEVPAFARS